jgi:nucleotide-binding universal stress UspA family protein
MAIKDILLLLDSNGEGQAANAYAGVLANSLDAHLTAAGIAFELLAPSAFAGDYPYEMLASITEQSRERTAKAYERLRAASPDSLRSELVQMEALPGQARDDFARLARHFDLTIIGQSEEVNDDASLMAESALFNSGRPVVFVPRIQTKAPSFERVLVAWDGSHAAARALSDSLPLIEKAKVIEVISIAGPRVSYKELPGFNITRHLSRHGLNAESKRLPVSGDIGDTILSYAADAGSDFLVMGGYGHSRLREFVLGGTTRTILTSMTLPVLMSH